MHVPNSVVRRRACCYVPPQRGICRWYDGAPDRGVRLLYDCGTILNKPSLIPSLPEQPDSLALALAEVRDLQRTVVVLRGELESAHQERQRQLQDALAGAHNETQQIKDTVATLRCAGTGAGRQGRRRQSQ